MAERVVEICFVDMIVVAADSILKMGSPDAYFAAGLSRHPMPIDTFAVTFGTLLLPSTHGKPLPVMPGMTGSVEVRTGERSVTSHLLRPMLKSKEALQGG